jgi:hypothetical protein
MEENMKELQAKGLLASFVYNTNVIRGAEPEYPMPSAKRPKTKRSENSAN